MKKTDFLLGIALVAMSVFPAYGAGRDSGRGVTAAPNYDVTGLSLPRHQIRKSGSVVSPVGERGKRLPVLVTEAAGAPVAINGFVVYSENDPATGAPAHAKGMYKIVSDGTFTNLNATDDTQDLDATFGGVLVGDTYYCTYVWDSGTPEIGQVPFIQKWDANTWTLLDANIPQSGEVLAYDLTYDPVSEKIYGLFVNGTSQVLGILNPEAGTRTTIGPLDRLFASIAADDTGVLYGIDQAAGQLWTINPQTAKTTYVGSTGVVSAYAASACYDSASGKILWTPTTASDVASLYAIDPFTGSAQKMVDFEYGDQVVGIFAVEAGVVSGRPNPVGNLTATFAGGSKEGTVSFTAPATNADGSVSASLTYSVTVDDSEPLTGSVAYGATATVPVTVDTDGRHTFAVSVSNEAGTSQVKRVAYVVGFGIPMTPTVTLERTGDMNHVSWTAVSTTTDGGFIDPSAVTYKVTRFPDKTVVAPGTAATSLDDEIAADGPYSYFYYEVVAVNGSRESLPGVSNRYDGGFITPPYLQTFDDASALDGYTVLNVNGDKEEWIIDSQAAYLKYNSSMAADDWLITPPVVMEAGKLYGIYLDVRGRTASYAEKFAVMLGTGATPDAMTQTVIPETEFQNAEYTKYLEYVSVPADGTYYIGVHGCSDKNKYALYVDNLGVTAPISAQAPGAISEIKVVPSPDGSASATISFKAPATDVAGNALAGAMTSLTVSRGGTVVKTFPNPGAGEVLSFVDTADEEGDYSYTAVAANSYGEGRPTDFKAYLGVNVPGRPTNIDVTEPSVGKVTISWDAPAADADGNPINAGLITYNVYRPNDDGRMVVLERGITETSYTYQARPASIEQAFETYGVQAVTRRGASNVFTSATVPVGTPYGLPYKESFKDGAEHHVHAVKMITGGEWDASDDNSLSGLTSVDGDNGFMAMYSNIATESSMLHTGKIDLGEAQRPVLTLYTYNIVARDPDTGEVVGSIDQNKLTISVNDRTEGFVDELTVAMNELPAEGWNRLVVDLTPYKGKVVELGFTAFVVNKQYTLIDDVRVFDRLAHNLSVAGVTAPAAVSPDKAYAVAVTVENNGENPSQPYQVELYRNDVRVHTAAGPALEFGEKGTVTFDETLNVTHGADQEYHAVVVYDPDLDQTDNTSAKVPVKLRLSSVPSPRDLTASADYETVSLQWVEPDPTVVSDDPVTEDFEQYESFAKENVGGWTFVDADELPIGDMNSVGMPGVEHGYLMSWFVNDASFDGWKGSIKANSGDKFLAQVYAEGGACDDWLISPRLYGGAQTVTFYARSYNSRYLESMEMLYSSTTAEQSAFEMVKNVAAVSSTWYKYSFDLPEGAEYFAIRCTSDDKAMLFIDDITYIPYVEKDLTVTGYNVYRDGVRVNGTPVGTTAYTDVVDVAGDTESHVYVVSALYAEAESRPSNEASVEVVSGLKAAFAAGVTIATAPGEIVVGGAEGYTVGVHGVNGITLFRAPGSAETRISVAPGTYVVTVGVTVAKVQVR